MQIECKQQIQSISWGHTRTYFISQLSYISGTGGQDFGEETDNPGGKDYGLLAAGLNWLIHGAPVHAPVYVHQPIWWWGWIGYFNQDLIMPLIMHLIIDMDTTLYFCN